MWRLSLFAVVVSAALGQAPGPEFFEMKVRPVLAKNCFGCHAASKMGGLDLTSREAMLKGGKRGPALVAGSPEGSLLIAAIRQTDPGLKMPPSGKLSDEEISVLTNWVRFGGEWPKAAAPVVAGGKITPEQRAWWSFQPVKQPDSSFRKSTPWAKTEVDEFVSHYAEKKGVTPVGAADRRTLIRRAYYDLTGLPPSAEEVYAFEKDREGSSFRKIVDKLLDSPQYGERWGRYWLDVARYSDDRLNSTMDDPYPNAWRYRDWVIGALNADMPYDLFLKAQIAGDQLDRPDKEKLVAGLGFYALSPEFQDDRVDATTRGFLALTAACAQCHDHKFDPIPTKDYYAMLGVFTSTKLGEYPLAPAETVKEFQRRKQRIEDKQKEIDDWMDRQANQLGEVLAAQTAEYLRAAREVAAGKAKAEGLDGETLDRWVQYLTKGKHEHPFLKDWAEPGFDVEGFGERVMEVIREKKKVDDTNFIRLGGSERRGDLAAADLLSLERDKYFLWRDVLGKDKFGKFDSGILYYKGEKLDRFLSGEWKRHLDSLRAQLAQRKKELPEQYPFYHVVEDVEKPKNLHVYLRGNRETPGEEAPRAFMSVLCDGEPKPFAKGSGRLELAEAIASKSNPLTARVIVNRVWMYHFGTGLVGTPSNFGQLGEKPSHPALLDYLAWWFMENGWSLKKLHRLIMNSAVYQLSSANDAKNFAVDPENRYYWRFNRRRLDIEPMRDTLLAVTGELEAKAGGPPQKITEAGNKRRTVYGFVSRRKLDGTLSLFDFPNPNSLSEVRIQTATPLQQLFFMNSGFMEDRAKALASRLSSAGGDEARIKQAYRLLYQREATAAEVELGVKYLGGDAAAWPRYAQVLLSANELVFVN
ncbi:MAG: PSD1 domain-containing protein [Bryobacterales bacterium]|nr:PSD1 domain-containing protein [Bryobacterales bacterium]